MSFIGNLKKFIRPTIIYLIIFRLNNYYKRFSKFRKKINFIKTMNKQHRIKIKELEGKKKIRVLFFVIYYQMWKVDSVFKKMLLDEKFEPQILVAPSLKYSGKHLDMDTAYNYFIQKKYPVIKAYNAEANEWLNVRDTLNPDIIFFTYPPGVTDKDYSKNLFTNFLSCYVPYSHEISKTKNYHYYNSDFHNAMWKIFGPHQIYKKIATEYMANKGKNVTVTGYPAVEKLIDNNYLPKEVWKKQGNKKIRLIWAPHHTIDEGHNLQYSTFLKFASLFKELSITFEREVQWAFKPHPLLKPKLYKNNDWGKDKTDNYYLFWEKNDHTQLEEGEYVDLFLTSDAMIHDSGSFLAEYLYTQKPVMYLVKSTKISDFLNPLGDLAFQSCYHGFNEQDVRRFFNLILNITNDYMNTKRKEFIDLYLYTATNELLPSSLIINIIKEDLKF